MATTTILVAQTFDNRILSRMKELIARRGGVSPAVGAAIVSSEHQLTALFATATEAVSAAIATLQQLDLEGRRSAGEATQTQVQIGITIGDVLDDGHTDGLEELLTAARSLAATARGGEVLASSLVRHLVAGQSGIEWSPTAESQVWRALWSPLPNRSAITVVVAEDAALIRAGIVALLKEEGFEVLAEVGDLASLLAAVRKHHPQLVVTDVRMPPTQRDEGLTAVAELRAEQPNLAVLVVSQHVEPAAAALLLDGQPAGVGYLLKERVSHLEEFIAACRTVTSGGVVIDPLVTERLVQRRGDAALDRLTDREREVLDLMAQGRSNAAIAAQVHCSSKTLEAHVRSIFIKLDLAEHPNDHRRVAAVVHYLHHRR